MAILRQHRQNKKIQSMDPTPKQNGALSNGDAKHTDVKEERIITSGGVPKNGKEKYIVTWERSNKKSNECN